MRSGLKIKGLAFLFVVFFLMVNVTGVQTVGADVYEPLLKVEVEGYRLIAGEENELTIKLTNVGSEVAYNVEAILSVPSMVSGISIISGSYHVFTAMRSGYTENLHIALYVADNCPLGSYSLNLQLRYDYYSTQEDRYIPAMVDVQIGVIVDSLTPKRLELEVDVDNYRVKAGTENEVTLHLTNMGEEALYDVKVSLTSSISGIVVLEGLSHTFNEIDVGEEVNFKSLLGVSKSIVLGVYPLTLNVEYKDSKGVTYRDSIIVGISVDSVITDRFSFKAEVKNYNLTAGIENEIEVLLTNTGNSSAYDVNIQLSSMVGQIAILRGASHTFSVIEPNSTIHFKSTLGVSREIPLGTYSLTLTIKYYDSDGTLRSDSLTVGVFVNSVTTHKYAFKAEVSDYKIRAGKENKIKVAVTNLGSASVYEVDVQLTSTVANIIVLEGAASTFNMIKPNSTVYFEATVGVSRATPLGVYPLTLTLKYKDTDGVSHIDSLNLGVFVDSVEPADHTTIVVQNFQAVPPLVHPGDDLTIVIELQDLEAEAYNVKAQLIADPTGYLTLLSPSLIFIGDLNPNETSEIVYRLHISENAKAQPYPIQLNIQYYDIYGQPNSISESISINVRSKAIFRLINMDPSNLILKTGETVTIEADLLLIGTESADFVQIEVAKDTSESPFLTTSESYEYIGRVDPDNPVPFGLQFTVKSDAATGDYTLPLVVTYWDEYNQERQATIELPVVIEEKMIEKTETSLTFWNFIWVILRMLFGMRI